MCASNLEAFTSTEKILKIKRENIVSENLVQNLKTKTHTFQENCMARPWKTYSSIGICNR